MEGEAHRNVSPLLTATKSPDVEAKAMIYSKLANPGVRWAVPESQGGTKPQP